MKIKTRNEGGSPAKKGSFVFSLPQKGGSFITGLSALVPLSTVKPIFFKIKIEEMLSFQMPIYYGFQFSKAREKFGHNNLL